MKFQHFTSRPLKFDPTRTYDQTDTFKPHGFWVSIEGTDDWKAWCEREEFRTETLVNCTEFEIDLTNVIQLHTTLDILSFTDRFRVSLGFRHASVWINWEEVAALYSGIIITPYNWECRYHRDTTWYYSWDCASGCIWDLSILTEVKS